MTVIIISAVVLAAIALGVILYFVRRSDLEAEKIVEDEKKRLGVDSLANTPPNEEYLAQCRESAVKA